MVLVTKKCLCCGQLKDLAQFSEDRPRKDGLKVYCRACANTKRVEFAKANPGYHRKYMLSGAKNSEHVKKWQRENKEKHRIKQERWRLKNPWSSVKAAVKARAKLRNRMPSWLSAEALWEIHHIYQRRLPTDHVDHIIPLNGKDVSGLHVPWNLQYLTAEENKIKRNSFDGTYENKSWRLTRRVA